MLKNFLYLFIGVGLFLMYASVAIYPKFPIATGYAAKKMCSCHFIADRTQQSIQMEDLANYPLFLTSTAINENEKKVTSSIFGMAHKTAVYKENLGCILLNGKDDYNIKLTLQRPEKNYTKYWPLGEKISHNKVKGVNYTKLYKAIDKIFDPSLKMDSLKTRAVVIIHKDTLIAEKYAKNFDKNTEILGWSMNKSITSTLIGILVKDKKLNIEQNQLFPNWTDKRSKITVNNLLQMESGLAFEENYSKVSDVTKMLFMNDNLLTNLVKSPLDTIVGSKWSYSSGTTNLLIGVIEQQFENKKTYLEFPYKRLFDKINMNSMIWETDESGNYLGSSYGYATPRDWAKFGLLYLHEGNWYGEQIIDSSWVDYTRKPATHSNGKYGVQFWQNHNHVSYKDAPSDLYSCNGFEGQYIFIIPSKDLVIVRMGLSKKFDINQFLKEIIEAVSGSEEV